MPSHRKAATNVSVRLAVTVRHFGDQTLPDRAPPADRRHVRLCPGFIDENKASGVNARLALPPLQAPMGDVSAILLAGVQAFFNAETGPVEEEDAGALMRAAKKRVVKVDEADVLVRRLLPALGDGGAGSARASERLSHPDGCGFSL
jgi:hypothetical protein